MNIVEKLAEAFSIKVLGDSTESESYRNAIIVGYRAGFKAVKPIATVKGIELFEGDKVLVKGTKRVGEYETEIIKAFQGWTLKENKTYLNDDKCFTAIIRKI